MRSIVMSLIAAAFALGLAACGRDEPPATVEPTPAPAPATAPAPTAPMAQPDPVPTQGAEVDESVTEGDLDPDEAAAIASQHADGKESTEEDGRDAQGNLRSHLESDTAEADETETPEDDERQD